MTFRSLVLLSACCALPLHAAAVEARRHPRVPSAFEFALGERRRLTIRDDGVDVTQARYAEERGFPQPLELVRSDLAGEDWAERPVPYGTLLLDARRGRMKFHGGRDGPVELVRRVRLPNGKALDAAWRGDHLLFMTDSNLTGLLVADVSDPSQPRVVAAEPNRAGAWTTSMVLAGDVVYAAVGGVLHAWDVSDPAAPKALPPLRCGASLLAAQGETLYFIKGRNTLGSIGISTPERPTPGPLRAFEAAERIEAPRFLGDLVLVTARLKPDAVATLGKQDGPWKVVTLDLKEGIGPDEPRELVPVVYVLRTRGVQEPEPVACWVGGPAVEAGEVGGKRLVLLRASRGGVGFVDAGDPAAPEVIGIRPELTGSVKLDGGRLYVARRNPWRQDGGLFVYALDDLKKPSLLGKLTQGDARWMEERSEWRVAAVRGSHVCVVDPLFGFLIVDVLDPSKPRIVGALHEAGRWVRTAVTDGRIFLAGDPGGLAIFDNTRRGAPQRLASFMVGPGWDVDGQATVAYAANGAGLRIVETGRRGDPLERGSVGGIPGARVVCTRAHLAYILGTGRGAVVDTAGREPRVVGTFPVRQPADACATAGWLCVADEQDGLVVVRIDDPTQPRVARRLALPAKPTRIAVRGSHAFVGTKDGLLVLDIRKPRIVAESREARGGVLAGDCLYAAVYYGEHNLIVTDVSDPLKPRVVARYSPGRHGYATDVAFHRGLVYLTSLPYLSILRTPVSSQAPRGRVTIGPVGIP